MKIGILMKILWRRHWWELCVLVLFSLTLSGLVLLQKGDQFLRGLVWLEAGSLVWLVARVSLTQSGFGTFGGWKSRPAGRGRYLVSEGLFFGIPLGVLAAARLFVGGELLNPNAEGWGELLSKGRIWLFWLLLMIGFCKLVGLGWELRDSPRSRQKMAWGMILVAVTCVLGVVNSWGGKMLQKSFLNHPGVMMSPLALDGVEDWQWLRAGGYSFVNVGDVEVGKMALREGASLETHGLRVVISKVEVRGERVLVTWCGSRLAGFEDEIPTWSGVMISYGGRYFGVPDTNYFKERWVKVPLLNLRRVEYSAAVLSPLALPENQLSEEELLENAEFWVSFGEPEQRKGGNGLRREEPENEEERLRWSLAGNQRKVDVKKVRGELDKRGKEAIDEVLAAEPWSEAGWEKVVMPYLLQFAKEEDLPRLLELLDLNPWMADLFLEKGWSEEAEAILRKHLSDGKTLTKQSVIFLAGLGEEEMGDDLVNQMLRMGGDFDAVAQALMKHPGVNWDEVRREAWRRMATGFGGHHVWVQWGVEMGEKEALRRMLVEASQGKKWEREMLELWFGKEGDVVEKLRKYWEEVEFREGKWMMTSSGL